MAAERLAVDADLQHDAAEAVASRRHRLDREVEHFDVPAHSLTDGREGGGDRPIARRDCGAISKVIIEAALLTDDEKVTACTLAKAAGADYVKTSTGFGPGGATAADVALMRKVVGADMGVKAAGGVRDLHGLQAMVAAGATRVGASAGVKIVQQARAAAPGSGALIPQRNVG